MTPSLVAGQLLTHPSAPPESSSPAPPLDFTKASNEHKTGNLCSPAASGSCCPGSFCISSLFPPLVTPSLTAQGPAGSGAQTAALQNPFQAVLEEMHLLCSLIMSNTFTQPEAQEVLLKAFTSPSSRRTSFFFLNHNTPPSLSDFPHQLSSHIHLVLAVLLLVSHPASLSYSILLPKLPAFLLHTSILPSHTPAVELS